MNHSTQQSLPTTSAACCDAAVWMRRAATLTLVALIGCSAYLYGRNQTLQTTLQRTLADAALASMPTMTIDGQEVPLVDATGAVVSDKFSIATGPISDDSDGFFMLDHNSGLLQCQVIYPRIGQVGASFAINAAGALGTSGKGGSYLMLTGRVNFPRASNRPAASVVVYVMDTATGNFVCYGVPFNESAVNSGRTQQGALVLITQGSANPLIDRDALR